MRGLVSFSRRMRSAGLSGMSPRRFASLRRALTTTMMLFFRLAEMDPSRSWKSSRSRWVTLHSGMPPKWGRT